MHDRVRRGRQGIDRPHALAARVGGRRASGDRRTCGASCTPTVVGSCAARSGSTAKGHGTSSRRMSCSARPTASVPRACSSPRRRQRSRTGSPTPPAWSGAISCATRSPRRPATSTTCSARGRGSTAGSSARPSSTPPIASEASPRGAKWTLCPTGGPTGGALAENVWGADHHRAVRERFGRTALWLILAEDLPDPENRVVLADELTDEYGIPAPARGVPAGGERAPAPRLASRTGFGVTRSGRGVEGRAIPRARTQRPHDGNRASRHRSADVGRRSLVHGARRPEPRCRRQQRLRHVRRCESDEHAVCRRATRGRASGRAS